MPASSMPSPMAINPASQTPSMFRKKKSSSVMSTAASYLSAVSQADARARGLNNGSTTSTPALSLSSSITASSEDTVLHEDIPDDAEGLYYPSVPPTSEQVFRTVHTEFGHCANESFRYTSRHPPGQPVKDVIEQDPPYYVLLTTYLSYILVICLGHIRDFVGKRLKPAAYRHLMMQDVRRVIPPRISLLCFSIDAYVIMRRDMPH